MKICKAFLNEIIIQINRMLYTYKAKEKILCV